MRMFFFLHWTNFPKVNYYVEKDKDKEGSPMRKYLIGLLIGLILLMATPFAFAADTIRLVVNGRDIYSDVPPQIVDGRTMIPVRALAESLGAQVSWDESTSSVIVTKPEKTKIVEPKPINTTGQIQITGPSDFKESVEQALALLKEKSPEDYKLVTNFATEIQDKDLPANSMAKTLIYSIVIDWDKHQTYTSRVTQKDKITILAGTIVHESYHIYLSQKGLPALPKMFSSDDAKPGILVIEDEALAYLRQRQTYTRMGVPKYILDTASIDKAVDSNNYNTIPSFFQ